MSNENIENIENKENKELKASTIANREKKKEAREAKAARKAANVEEDKKKRPSNLVLTILIFGVIIFMFVFVKAYGYLSKPANIEAYLSENSETYSNMMVDAFTTADITAEGNSMTIALKADTMGDESATDYLKEYYEGEDGEETLKYLGAYFLTTMKPEVRGFSADVTVNLSIGDEEVKSVKMTYKEAKDFMKPDEEEAEEDADAETEDAEETAEDAAEETEEVAEDAAEEAAEDAAEGE